jgi:hypothetical protein
MTLQVGQRVRVVATEERLRELELPDLCAGLTGVLTEDDGSSLPLCVEFDNRHFHWFCRGDVEGIPEAPATQQDPTVDKIEMAQLRVELAKWEATSRAWERLYREAVSR